MGVCLPRQYTVLLSVSLQSYSSVHSGAQLLFAAHLVLISHGFLFHCSLASPVCRLYNPLSRKTLRESRAKIQTECARQEWQGARERGSDKVTVRRKNKVSVSDYNNCVNHLSAAISAHRSLPLLSSASVELNKPEPRSTVSSR